ncbi:MAG: hypothetical protein M3015_12560 [Bacteroidota bacterium]|nr:hypothetical protein [Bacteroidota bacterium]
MLQTQDDNLIIDNIVEEVQKLSPGEQQQLLIKIRLSNYLKKKRKPIANFDKKKIKPPTLKQIDNWKHSSRISK